MPVWTQFAETTPVFHAGQASLRFAPPSVATSTALSTAGPSCTLPRNPRAGQPGVNDPYFASQADHDAWVASHSGCPPPPYLPDTPPQVPAPSLVSPPDSASVPAGVTVFKWTAPANAGASNIRICTGPNGTGSCDVTSTNPGDTSTSIPLSAGTYYWSMNSMDDTGVTPGPWSADKTIIVTAPGSQPVPSQAPPMSPPVTPRPTPPAASTLPSLGVIGVVVGISAVAVWMLYQHTQQEESGADRSEKNSDESSIRSSARSSTRSSTQK